MIVISYEANRLYSKMGSISKLDAADICAAAELEAHGMIKASDYDSRTIAIKKIDPAPKFTVAAQGAAKSWTPTVELKAILPVAEDFAGIAAAAKALKG